MKGAEYVRKFIERLKGKRKHVDTCNMKNGNKDIFHEKVTYREINYPLPREIGPKELEDKINECLSYCKGPGNVIIDINESQSRGPVLRCYMEDWHSKDSYICKVERFKLYDSVRAKVLYLQCMEEIPPEAILVDVIRYKDMKALIFMCQTE